MSRRRRSQALAEFSLALPIMLMIAFTTLDLFGFITARGRVFDLAAATLEAATAAKLPYDPALDEDSSTRRAQHTAQRDFLCAQLYAVAAGVARSNGLPGSGTNGIPLEADPAAPCSESPTTSRRVTVTVGVLQNIEETIDPTIPDPNPELSFSDPPSEFTATYDPTDPLRKPVYVRVCVKYLWVPQSGVLYFARGFGLGAKVINKTLTWHFCGRTAIDPRRSG